ncbi:MAG: hypothetical protein KatS3mg108_2542 [Isosphaeraceae bacterium]|nr:MAG: hypothetical protein KatS3mg108_2542 [Isosphaeraceae bacterium]
MSVAVATMPRWLGSGLIRLGLVLLVVVEGLLLSLWLDFGLPDRSSGGWTGLLQLARYPFGAGLVFLLVAGLVLWSQLRRGGKEWLLGEGLGWLRWQIWPLMGHGVVYVAVWRLAPGVLAEPTPVGVGVWAGLALVSGVLWLAAAVPWKLLASVGAEAWVAVGAGVLGALGATGLAGVSGELWQPLRAATFEAAQLLLRVFPVEVVCDPDQAILGTAQFQVRVARACSGYEGLGLMVVFLVVTFWLFRRELKWPNALVLVPIGLVGIWCLNVVRIVVLILIGHAGHSDVALGGFHSQAGWLAFNGAGLGLVALARRWRFVAVDSGHDGTGGEAGRAERAGVTPTLAYLGPMLAIVLASMVGEAAGDGAVRFYPLRVVAAGWVLWVCRRAYGDATWWPSGRGLWAVGVGVVVFGLWMMLEPGAAGRERAPVDVATPWGVFWLACRVVGSVVLVPIAEELAFRGYLMRRLIAGDFQAVPMGTFRWPSFVVSSVLFGLLHSRWLAGALAGALYGLAVCRRGRLGDAMLAHAVTNGLIAVWAIVGGRWSLWS